MAARVSLARTGEKSYKEAGCETHAAGRCRDGFRQAAINVQQVRNADSAVHLAASGKHANEILDDLVDDRTH